MVAGYTPTQAAAPANSLIHQAIEAERKGEFKLAYLLWAQAAVKSPELWAKAKKFESYAGGSAVKMASAEPLPDTFDPELSGPVTTMDLDDASRLGSPRRLKPFPGTRRFHLKGDLKTLFERVTQEFGYQVVLDRDLMNAPPAQLRFDIEPSDYETALHALEAATNTFLVPISATTVLAAADTTQKRNELEPSAVQIFLIPERSTVQEAQEVLMAVQQSLEIRRAVLDPVKRLILIRGP